MAELEDLALYVPNVHIAEGAITSLLFIRGIGSGMNPGYEQSVGTFVVGKNLGDEATTTFGNDVPLGCVGFDGTYFQHIDPPCTITLQGRWWF